MNDFMHFPVFIVGNPRSGTTLLRLMLTNHKNIVIPPEAGFAVWLYDKYSRYDFSSKAIVINFVRDLTYTKKIETWNLDFSDLLDFMLEVRVNSYTDAVAAVYEYYGHSLGRNFLRWGDKNNYYLNHIDILSKMYPSAQFIHIVRDGRDVACSYQALQNVRIVSKYAPQLVSNIKDIAWEWSQNICKIRSAFENLPEDNIYEIRYEDLVAHTERELKKVCLFLQEPYDKNMELFFQKNRIEHQEPVEFLQWKAKTLQKPTKSEVGKYKTILSQEEIEDFEYIASSALKLYQYQVNISQ